jgi:hypothetical protein
MSDSPFTLEPVEGKNEIHKSVTRKYRSSAEFSWPNKPGEVLVVSIALQKWDEDELSWRLLEVVCIPPVSLRHPESDEDLLHLVKQSAGVRVLTTDILKVAGASEPDSRYINYGTEPDGLIQTAFTLEAGIIGLDTYEPFLQGLTEELVALLTRLERSRLDKNNEDEE